jgi:hypothetical protein
MATGCIFDQAPLTSSETVLEAQAAKPGVCRILRIVDRQLNRHQGPSARDSVLIPA